MVGRCRRLVRLFFSFLFQVLTVPFSLIPRPLQLALPLPRVALASSCRLRRVAPSPRVAFTTSPLSCRLSRRLCRVASVASPLSRRLCHVASVASPPLRRPVASPCRVAPSPRVPPSPCPPPRVAPSPRVPPSPCVATRHASPFATRHPRCTVCQFVGETEGN